MDLRTDMNDPLIDPLKEDKESTQILVNIGNHEMTLDIKDKLGEGAFGVVHKAVDIRGNIFAVKQITCRDADTYYSISQEVEMLLSLRHRNIVQMYAFDFMHLTALLIMEYCEQGTLNTRLSKHDIDMNTQYMWLEQLASALTYLHSKNIVHRDLKTENILLTESDDAKISDFGISRYFVCLQNPALQHNQNDPNLYLSEYMGTFAGTPFWVAPEVFDHKYTEKADVFSLGVIFHAIIEQQSCRFEGEEYFGVFVKHENNDVGIGLAMYEQNQILLPVFTAEKRHNRKLQEIICQMLTMDPEERASLLDVRSVINDTFVDLLKQNNPDQVSYCCYYRARKCIHQCIAPVN